jgi:mRNA-degrading endonuclease YafQ of YafQ-DinJ toxin-antitoxin module
MNLVWSAKFSRAIKRAARRDKKVLSEIERTLTQLAADSKHVLCERIN